MARDGSSALGKKARAARRGRAFFVVRRKRIAGLPHDCVTRSDAARAFIERVLVHRDPSER
ncbi:hypothetical protein NTJ56_03060 [Burkholderia contaminans]|uniref:hypothetical protein n=1 Tax=Burkholderia contaminans TaxID=488447 RepID=UPI001CF24590|nr:hypothetical protein [Burkholderia contaminans]MCA7919136.1 hypothetical protein [Burkholderia contaminans]MCA8100493.1 hypothetical protein [Burkholderia contaminans]UUX37817.1 hypothetical protein NTJ56_03060 [Burkholderia contaminans]